MQRIVPAPSRRSRAQFQARREAGPLAASGWSVGLSGQLYRVPEGKRSEVVESDRARGPTKDNARCGTLPEGGAITDSVPVTIIGFTARPCAAGINRMSGRHAY